MPCAWINEEKSRSCKIFMRSKLILCRFWQVWVETGDIVLVSLREYEDDKADIIHKYYTGEATHLIRVGEIPDSGTLL